MLRLQKFSEDVFLWAITACASDQGTLLTAISFINFLIQILSTVPYSFDAKHNLRDVDVRYYNFTIQVILKF